MRAHIIRHSQHLTGAKVAKDRCKCYAPPLSPRGYETVALDLFLLGLGGGGGGVVHILGLFVFATYPLVFFLLSSSSSSSSPMPTCSLFPALVIAVPSWPSFEKPKEVSFLFGLQIVKLIRWQAWQGAPKGSHYYCTALAGTNPGTILTTYVPT